MRRGGAKTYALSGLVRISADQWFTPMTEPAERRRRRDFLALTPRERLQRFAELQAAAWSMMSDEGKARFYRRNIKKRRAGRAPI